MERAEILEFFKEHQTELSRFGVHSLFLFGSFARGEENESSDLDILVTFEGTTSFDDYMELKFFLEDVFGRKVDLVTEKGLRSEIKPYIDEDRIRVA